jgi:crossover junction endodeoxyribonuclease RuvC
MTMSAKSIPTQRSPKQLPYTILACDPGFERLGVAVMEREGSRERLVYSDCIRTSASDPFPTRLKILGKAVEALIKKYRPRALALEEVFFEKNAKTAMQVAEVRGMLTYIAASKGLAAYQYTTLEVKVAVTGYGKSDKHAVAAMVGRLVALPEKKRLDDELDAIAIGLTCLASSRYPHAPFAK